MIIPLYVYYSGQTVVRGVVLECITLRGNSNVWASNLKRNRGKHKKHSVRETFQSGTISF